MLIKDLKNINEIYSEPNSRLLQYMKDKPMNLLYHRKLISKWFEQNPEYIRYAKKVANKTNMSGEDFIYWIHYVENESDMDFFYKLHPKMQKMIHSYVIKHKAVNSLSFDDVKTVPTWVLNNLKRKNLIKRNTWLIHFSNNATQIAKEGFTKGVDDISKLSLTKHLSDKYKTKGGYNFAFLANSKGAKNAVNYRPYDYILDHGRYGKYGRDAVMFLNSGINTYHVGDKETQIIFWGPDIDPRKIVLLNQKYNKIWAVRKHPLSNYSKNEDIFEGRFDKVVSWVKNNWHQYSKIIMGY